MAASDFSYFAGYTVRLSHISAISDVVDTGPENGSTRYRIHLMVGGVTLTETYAFEEGATLARSDIADAMEV